VPDFPQIAAALSNQPAAAQAATLVPETLEIAEPDRSAPELHGASGAATHHPATLAALNADGDVRPLEEIEAELIRFAISHYRGQMSEVARKLKIGRSTLYRKLEGLGLGNGLGAADTTPHADSVAAR
jgi:DNA-binding NtrC family response regulator